MTIKTTFAKVIVLSETTKFFILLLTKLSLIFNILGRNAGTRDERQTFCPFPSVIYPCLLHLSKSLSIFAKEFSKQIAAFDK